VRSPRWSVSPSVCTCRSGPVGDVDLPSGLLGLGSCVRPGPLGFHIPRKRTMGVWSLLRVCRSVCDYIRALDVPGAGCPRGGSTPPPGVCGIGAAARTRRAIVGALSAFVCVVSREPPPLAVRCVLFSVDRGVGCFSSRNWNHRFLWGFASEPASEPASDRGDLRPK